MSKKCESHLYYVSMFALGRSILLMSVWAGNKIRNADAFEERIKCLIFTPPIGLHSPDFFVKLSLHKTLEVLKTLKNFKFITQQVNPGKFGVIINEADIILKTTD